MFHYRQWRPRISQRNGRRDPQRFAGAGSQSSPHQAANLSGHQKSKARLLFHAELGNQYEQYEHVASEDRATYANYLDTRPESFETSAIEMIARLQAEFPTVPMHVVHLSAASALPIIRKARAAGLPLTCETCFHYRGPHLHGWMLS